MTMLRDELQTALGNGYTVERELSGGGMSRIFVADESGLGRKVVIKVLPPEMQASMSVERFLREIQVAAQLQHPHILPLLTAGTTPSSPFFTMPLVHGEPLDVRLSRDGVLPVRETVRLLREVASALAYAHEHGVVHRDIKPANIMLSGDSAMVTDFGVAKALNAGGADTVGTLTVAGFGLGTPAYISPEQAAADPGADHRSDIYSFGAMAYELLSGTTPFGARSPQRLFAAHLTEEPKLLGDIRPGLPQPLASLVMKCLEKDPADRPANAKEIVRALDLLATPSGSFGVTGEHVAERHQPSIAVMPFANLSSDPENEFFSDGVTEEILNTLAALAGIRVAARTSSFAFKGERVDVQEIGRQLGVESVLEGSVRKAAKRVRISAQLVNVADGCCLWSEQYDRDLEDIFGIQDEIARTIVGHLRVRISGAQEARLEKRHPGSVEAYELYLRGRHCWNQRGMLPKAVRYFREAMQKDPSYALAHHGLADAYGVLGLYAFAPSAVVMPKARRLAERAAELDPSLAEVHTTLGFIQTLAWDWAGAERSFQRARELNPQYALAYSFSAWLLTTVGRGQDAIDAARHAQSLDPLSPVTNGILALVLYHARDYTEAIRQSARVLDLEPNSFLALMASSLSYGAKGQSAESIRAAERGVALSPEVLFLRALLGTAYAKGGQTDGARVILADMERRAESHYVAPVLRSWILAQLGETDRAFETLDEAYAERACTLGLGMRFPLYDSLRDDPRFPQLFGKLGLRDLGATGC
ncbi:MAG: protein kinase domain-containing protein [Gemmatimonadaceae bacterium]